MDFKNLAGKAGDLLGQHDEKVDSAIDKAAEMAKGRFEGHDERIDGFADKAKGFEFGGGDEPPAADRPAE